MQLNHFLFFGLDFHYVLWTLLLRWLSLIFRLAFCLIGNRLAFYIQLHLADLRPASVHLLALV